MGSSEEYAIYLSLAEELLLMTPKSAAMEITLQASSFELFRVVPIMKLNRTNKLAPIGLTNMFNCGGTIQGLRYKASGSEPSAEIKVKGGGNFLAYSSECPKTCYLNGAEVALEWLAGINGGKVMLNLPWVEEVGGIYDVAFFF
jgi:stachyose synthetase